MRAINLKSIISHIPEISFLLMAIYWFLENLMASPSNINYFMLAVLLFVSALMIWRIRVFALILSIILGIGSLYMLLAVVSEFKEFPKGSPEGIELLITGSLIFLVLAGMAIWMPIKYLRESKGKKIDI